MAISHPFQKSLFEPEEIEAMAQAFEVACDALQMSNRDDAFGQLVASKVVECARDGVLDPYQLCELVASEFPQFARDPRSTDAA
jgi:hypothetical protein